MHYSKFMVELHQDSLEKSKHIPTLARCYSCKNWRWNTRPTKKILCLVTDATTIKHLQKRSFRASLTMTTAVIYWCLVTKLRFNLCIFLVAVMPDKSPPTYNTFTRGCIAFQTDSHCNPIYNQQLGKIVLLVPYVAIKWHKTGFIIIKSSSKID